MPWSPLAETVLALALVHAPPARSPYSYEPAPDCGSDPDQPKCELGPICSGGGFACRGPKFSRARGTWVRTETRATAVRRYGAIARAVSDTAERLTACPPESRDCEPIDWPGTTRSLALAALAIAVHESGLREDVQFGHAPLGRGPAGEVCLVQVAPRQAPRYASWIPEAERARAADSPARREKIAKTLLGDSPATLGRCFEVGMRMLARARASCGGAGVPWAYGMYSMYGSGYTCKAPSVADTRYRTFQKMMAARPRLGTETRRLLGLPEAQPPPTK